MQKLTHYHAIRIRYCNNGYTGRATITLKSWRFKQLVKLPYSYQLSTIEQAEDYLKAKGFNIIGYSNLEGTADYIVFSDTFKSIRE